MISSASKLGGGTPDKRRHCCPRLPVQTHTRGNSIHIRSTRGPFTLDIYLPNLCHKIRRGFISWKSWLDNLCNSGPTDKARRMCGHGMTTRAAFEHHVPVAFQQCRDGAKRRALHRGQGRGGGGSVPETKRGIVLLYTMGRRASYPYVL